MLRRWPMIWVRGSRLSWSEAHAFQSAGAAARSFVNYKGLTPDGKYIYTTMPATEDLVTRQAKGESQWAIQATLRYEF